MHWASLCLAMLTLAPMLAGCSDNGSGSGTAGGLGGQGDGLGGGLDAAEGLAAPEWQVGQWWNYTVTTADPQTTPGDYSLVVTQDLGSDWQVETDNPAVASFDRMFDVSNMGPIRKDDLAGSQGDVRVLYFQWPLVDGASWATTWDGQATTVTARDLGQGRFALEARQGTAISATYVYDQAAGWFSDLSFYADGQPDFTLKLRETGLGFAGKVARWTLDTFFEDEGDLAAADTVPATKDVPLEATDVYLSLHVECAAGTPAMGILAPPYVPGVLPVPLPVPGAGRGGGVPGTQCPMSFHYEGSVGSPQAPPQGGTSEPWLYGATATPDSVGTYRMALHVRTLTREPLA